MGRAFNHVCLCSKRQIAWAINSKLGTHVLYSSCSACIDPEVKRSRSHGYRKTVTVASDACCNGLCQRGSACWFGCLCFPAVVLFLMLTLWTNESHAFCCGFFASYFNCYSSRGWSVMWSCSPSPCPGPLISIFRSKFCSVSMFTVQLILMKWHNWCNQFTYVYCTVLCISLK